MNLTEPGYYRINIIVVAIRSTTVNANAIVPDEHKSWPNLIVDYSR